MNGAEVTRRLLAAADAIEAAQEDLGAADRAIGDGDHGAGMARAFAAVRKALAEKQPATPAEAFKTTGMAILSSAGGASGAVFGSYFMGLAKGAGSGDLTAETFGAALKEGASAVSARGGAKPGQKTMLDAAFPAAETCAGAETLFDALSRSAIAAEQGAQATIGMIATTGKAKTLGERSIGHIDPGAKSLAIILRAFRA
ncbi:MAG: dihydroxyacetone kinase subunit DhaL [Aestuariivirga sp.]